MYVLRINVTSACLSGETRKGPLGPGHVAHGGGNDMNCTTCTTRAPWIRRSADAVKGSPC